MDRYRALWLVIVTMVTLSLQHIDASGASDCIAEKFYRFTPEHTACILQSDGAEKRGVSEEEQKLIVDKHNELRGRQRATNMRKMVWDEELAKIAQRWTDNCEFNHDKYRTVPGKYSVGQNLAAGQLNWDQAIQGWYDEIDEFNYGVQESFSAVGHYTQLVWDKSTRIGCGYTYCTTLSYMRFYACNYGPAGNSNDWSKPYTRGSKCADCQGKCANGLCDCEGKVCYNGGELNLKTCECNCLKPWHILGECKLNCTAVKESRQCQPGGFYHGNCFRWSNVPYECPIHCNVCPYAGVEYEDKSKDTDGKDGSGCVVITYNLFVLGLSLLLI